MPVFCVNAIAYLFRCKAETLAHGLTSAYGARVVAIGVQEQGAVISSRTIRIVRYKGSEWCAVVPIDIIAARGALDWLRLLVTLSSDLRIEAVYLAVSDTASAAEYQYFKCGERSELLRIDERVYFESQDARSMKTADAYGYIDQRLSELGIIPPLFQSPFEDVGERIRSLEEIDADWEQIAEALLVELDPPC